MHEALPELLHQFGKHYRESHEAVLRMPVDALTDRIMRLSRDVARNNNTSKGSGRYPAIDMAPGELLRGEGG